MFRKLIKGYVKIYVDDFLAEKFAEVEGRVEVKVLNEINHNRSWKEWREAQTEDFLDRIIRRIKRKQL